jgi:hypothetical protein
MSKPFKGIVNIDIKDSVPAGRPYTQPQAPDGAPNVVDVSGEAFVDLARETREDFAHQ